MKKGKRHETLSPESDIECTDISRFNFKGRKFYFKTIWGDNSFAVDATDGRQLWSGEASADLLANTLCPKNMELTEYLGIVRMRQTLLNEHEFGTVSLSQAPEPNQAKLTWRIKVKDPTIQSDQQISLRGVILLDKLTDDRTAKFQEFMDKMITQLFFYKEERQILVSKVYSLEKQRNESLQRYDTLVKDKKGLEADLYSRFSIVLNSKKKKIRELREKLNQKSQKLTILSPPKPEARKITENARKQPIVDRGSDSPSTDSELMSFGEDSEVSEAELPASLGDTISSINPQLETPKKSPKRSTKQDNKSKTEKLHNHPKISQAQGRLSVVTPRDSLAIFDDFGSPSSNIKIKARKRRRVPQSNPIRPAVLPSISFLDHSPQKDDFLPARSPPASIGKRVRKPSRQHKLNSPSPKRRKPGNTSFSIDDLIEQAQ